MKDHIRHALFHVLAFSAMFVYSVRTGPWWFATFILVAGVAFFPITEDRLQILKRNLMPMALQPFQQRVVDEKAELDTKIKSLATFIENNSWFGSLPEVERMAMYAQRRVMVEYSIILGERIARFEY